MVNFLFSFLLSFLTAIAGLALRGAMPFGNGSLFGDRCVGTVLSHAVRDEGGNKERGAVLVRQRADGL